MSQVLESFQLHTKLKIPKIRKIRIVDDSRKDYGHFHIWGGIGLDSGQLMMIQVHTCNFYFHRFCIVADSTICMKQRRFRHNVVNS